jgi:AraC-like DNA-binding protein
MSIRAPRTEHHDREADSLDRDTGIPSMSADAASSVLQTALEQLRLHLATAPAAESGWIAALADPTLASALALLHADPARRWTVAEIAAGAAVSRSTLDDRVRDLLGLSPIRYLTEWRMHLAAELLATTETGVAVIARRVGYESEEAFSRAFKRVYGLSPSFWRVDRSS